MINYQTMQTEQNRSLDDAFTKSRHAFKLALAQTEEKMLQFATDIANDPRIRNSFLKGKLAVEGEGGGPGGEKIHVGAIKTGTSFTNLLKTLSEHLKENFTIFLTRDHLAENIWPEFLDPILDKTIYSVGAFPLRDFWGNQNPERPPVGQVLIWNQIDHEKWCLKCALIHLLTYAFFGYLILLAILYATIHFTVTTLERAVNKFRKELIVKAYDLTAERKNLQKSNTKLLRLNKDLKNTIC